jgi:putative tryptophan/tyrosine transport system substrate-binding protein
MPERAAARSIRSAIAAFVLALTAACGGGGGGSAPAGGDTSSGSEQPAYRMGILYFAPEEGVDNVFKGLFEGLKEQGFEEGRNLEVKRSHAQAEIANIPLLVQDLDSSGLDVIVAMTTPCLTAACSMVRNTPVVFTYVYDPIAAGAGTSATDHLPHITGVGSFPPVEDTVDVIQRLVPGVKEVGTVYNSSEANSRKVMEVARGAFKARGIALDEVTVTGTADLYQAAQAVASRGIQALWITGDNTALQGFDALAKVARDARLPLIINDPEFVARGALAAVGLGWYQAGRAAAPLIVRVMRGESPQGIPFEEVAVKKLVLNREVAKTLGITFPADLEAEAASSSPSAAPASAEG